MRRQSVMNSASVTIPPIVMDAAAQSAILLTPLMHLQMIESGAEAGFRLEAETLASAPPRDRSGGDPQSVFVLSEVVHAVVNSFVIGINSRSDARRKGKERTRTCKYRWP